MDLITHIYYINLESRGDRNAEILTQFEKHDIKNYTRINAIKDVRGCIGCSKSHVHTLQTIIATHSPLEGKAFLILEDDFTFHDNFDPEQVRKIFTPPNTPDYNVILFGGYIVAKRSIGHDYLEKCVNAQTTSGYLVRGEYIPALLKNFEEGLLKLHATRKPSMYAIDIYWKTLQSDKWFIMNPIVGYQRASYSDCENKHVDPSKIY